MTYTKSSNLKKRGFGRLVRSLFLKVDPRRFPKFHRSHEAFALLHGNAPFSTLSFNSQAVSALCALLFLRMILLLGLGIDRNCSSSASNACIVLRTCMSFRLDARIRIRGFFSTCVLPYISSASAPQPFMNIRSAPCRHTATACRPLDSLRELVHHGLGIRSSSSTMRLMPEPSAYLKLFCYFC